MNIIEETNQWYTNTEESFHKGMTVNGETYDLERMNFAKRLCSDDANLVETVDITVSNSKEANETINKILEDSNFLNMYRQQCEQMSANGTVGAYIIVENADIFDDGTFKGGKIKIMYCDTPNIFPITVINNQIIEVAFVGSSIVENKAEYKIVMFTLENGLYKAHTHVFNEFFTEQKEKVQIVQLGEVKPFSIMRVAESNNLKMKGYGFPKLWNAIPALKILDASMTMWTRDLSKSDKIILLNEAICGRDKNGNLKPLNKQMKNLFVQVGNTKLPEEKTLMQEYNPILRIDDVTKSIELALSLLSMSFGYGTKKYTFEKGRIVTATEYIGENQDAMKEVNKQREESTSYIKGIIEAIAYYIDVTQDKTIDISNIEIDYDDTYIEDKNSVAEALRNDALSFEIPLLMKKYFEKKYQFEDKDINEIMKYFNQDEDTEEIEE